MDKHYHQLTTPEERRDEQFVERVSICVEDAKLALPEAVTIARRERDQRLAHTLGPFANVHLTGRKQP